MIWFQLSYHDTQKAARLRCTDSVRGGDWWGWEEDRSLAQARGGSHYDGQETGGVHQSHWDRGEDLRQNHSGRDHSEVQKYHRSWRFSSQIDIRNYISNNFQSVNPLRIDNSVEPMSLITKTKACLSDQWLCCQHTGCPKKGCSRYLDDYKSKSRRKQTPIAPIKTQFHFFRP